MGNGMDKIVDGIYVGSIRDSKDQVQLKENNITHVLSVHDNAAKVRSKLKVKKDITYLCIAARDCATQDLSQYFSQTNDFIHRARLKDGNVLIHCLAGVSRSVTLTVAYLMSVTELGWRNTLNAVRGARRAANPNFGFQRQLLTFEHEALPEERRRMIKVHGPSPFNDMEQCRDLLERHREWVLHGDNPSKDEDHNTYPLPHKAYGQRTGDSLRQDGAGDRPRQKSPRAPRHTAFVGMGPPKDQKTLTLEGYLNVKAEREAKQYYRQQEEKALTDELMARSRSNLAGAASAPDIPAGAVGRATGGAEAAASATGSTPSMNDTTAKVDELFNSS